ncbi:MAG TPA: asparagine synthase (glutamine-hydrolyzing) [bacterium]|nr:asparagine synthase (glutamine-hydrolyzing) [bacterium]
MCGFTGFFDRARSAAADALTATVTRMADTLRHRGPDDGGTWVDAAAGVALGHRRLSIIDLSPLGHQPMLSASGRYAIAFNGEIYNFRELRTDLESSGAIFRGHSDTEVLLAAIELWGVRVALIRAVGMFSFALYDRTQRTVTLARDRIGEKPLYYGWAGTCFLFGSELKALRAHPSWSGSIDRDALALYLRHNYVPSPRTIYREFRKLIPGTYCTLALDGDRGAYPEPAVYWSAHTAAQQGLDRPFSGGDDAAVAEFERLLRQSIRGQMIADVPLGAFLSGGLDSSVVVALMQAQSDRPVRTFSIGFGEKEYNEAGYAKAVAQHLGTEHTELYVAADAALDLIPRLPHIFDEPFADSSQLPTTIVSELTRKYVTVALSGDAGDELLAGYNRYRLGQKLNRRLTAIPAPLRALLAPLASAAAPLASAVRPLVPAHWSRHAGGDKLRKLAAALRTPDGAALYLLIVSHWDDPAAVVIDGREPMTRLTNPAELLTGADFVGQTQYWDLISYLPDDILVKVDRSAMSCSLETRIPLLDHRIVEFAWSLPPRMKLRDGISKWVLRQVLYRHVPRELVERPKMGFGVPIDHWLRGPLRDWCESLISVDRLRRDGFFRPEPIREKWQQHLSGRYNWQYYIWDICMFQAWLDANR